MTKSTITLHHSTTPGDVNNTLSLSGDECDAGGANTLYTVTRANDTMAGLVAFTRGDTVRMTNEVLLAILIDRLEGFQRGPHQCDENAAALHHLKATLNVLKGRTRRLAEKEPKMAAEKPHRVRNETFTLHVGDAKFDWDALRQWKTWSAVEAACKKLNPELSPLELGVIMEVAQELGDGAKNGLAEMKSSLARTRKA